MPGDGHLEPGQPDLFPRRRSSPAWRSPRSRSRRPCSSRNEQPTPWPVLQPAGCRPMALVGMPPAPKADQQVPGQRYARPRRAASTATSTHAAWPFGVGGAEAADEVAVATRAAGRMSGAQLRADPRHVLVRVAGGQRVDRGVQHQVGAGAVAVQPAHALAWRSSIGCTAAVMPDGGELAAMYSASGPSPPVGDGMSTSGTNRGDVVARVSTAAERRRGRRVQVAVGHGGPARRSARTPTGEPTHVPVVAREQGDEPCPLQRRQAEHGQHGRGGPRDRTPPAPTGRGTPRPSRRSPRAAPPADDATPRPSRTAGRGEPCGRASVG